MNLLGGDPGGFYRLDREEQVRVLAYRSILLDPADGARTVLLHPLAVNQAHACVQGMRVVDRAPRGAPMDENLQRAVAHLVRAGNSSKAAKALLGVA